MSFNKKINMTKTIRTIFVVIAIFFLTSVGAHAVIFSGSEGTDEPGGVGYCLRYPDFDICKDPDGVYDTICDNPEYEDDLICRSEAEIGTDLAETSLRGTGITHTEDAGDLVIKYVNFALPYLTLAAFVGFVVAGFFYVTAYGNEEQLQKAKKILIWSVVGLLLVIMSYAIIQFLTAGLVEELQPDDVVIPIQD